MSNLPNPTVLFENEDFWVINKPAGWLSIPARAPKPEDSVLTTYIREHYATRNENQAFVVHRLDRFTSGVILFAKNEVSHQRANQWFQNREVKKVYHFLASPPPLKPAIQMKTPVDGKSAQTLFEVVEKTNQFFQGRATPLTGRFHQIREHAELAGFPILGDQAHHGELNTTIGGNAFTFPRVLLHAYELTLPFGTIQAPLPEDFLKTKAFLNFVVK